MQSGVATREISKVCFFGKKVAPHFNLMTAFYLNCVIRSSCTTSLCCLYHVHERTKKNRLNVQKGTDLMSEMMIIRTKQACSLLRVL